jgi:hypothetical protein
MNVPLSNNNRRFDYSPLLRENMASGKPKKTWRDRLEQTNPKHGIILECPEVWAKGKVDATMLIPVPMKIDALVRLVPEGTLVEMSEVRNRLARDAGADIACPMTTGIFLKFVAGAAEEDRANELEPAPYWRLLKDGGKLNPKYPGGVDDHAANLVAEGHEILFNRNGNPAKIANIEASLFSFD